MVRFYLLVKEIPCRQAFIASIWQLGLIVTLNSWPKSPKHNKLFKLSSRYIPANYGNILSTCSQAFLALIWKLKLCFDLEN